MSGSTKQVTVQNHHLLLYRRPLHPELFPPKVRKSFEYGQYEFEAWLLSSCHVMRFRHKHFTACELVVDQGDGLPIEGAVTSLPCAGEHEFEHEFSAEKVVYMTSVQTETLAENLYEATFDELIEHAEETKALTYRWADAEGGQNLSMLDIQRLAKEVHAQSYHMTAATGLVLRTQTIFEHR